VALARAIVRRPQVFLMDEPLSNLDAKLRTQTRLDLVEMHRRLGTTIVYVTHDQVEAMTMADRIAIIHEGRVQQVAPPQEVYDRPANLFVARFIGSPPMNTIEGTLEPDPAGAGAVVTTEAGTVSVADALGAPSGTRVVAAVRPEHFSLDPAEGLSGTVENVELLGHERHLLVSVAGSVMVARLEADTPAPALGEQVRLRAEPDRVHLFDAATTIRMDAR
jgi:multiple sugar transport system ATP-binding protein